MLARLRAELSANPLLLMFLMEGCSHVRQLPRIPRVTFTALLLNLLLAFRNELATAVLGAQRITHRDNLGRLLVSLQPRRLLSTVEYGLLPSTVWNRWMFHPSLVVSTFLTPSLAELLANMLPMMSTCSMLEQQVSSAQFVRLLCFASLAPNVLIVLLTRFWARVTRRSGSYSRTIYTGLAPMLFCLSTIRYIEFLAPRGMQASVYGWQVPCRLMPFVEIVIHRLLFPSSSVFSQLAGVTAGFLYARRQKLVSAFLALTSRGERIVNAASNRTQRSTFPGQGRAVGS